MSSSHLEEALRRSEEFAARLIESSRDCIKVLDLQGHLLSINAHGMTALEIRDFGPLIGSPWVEFWDGKDRERAKAALEQARQGQVGRFTGYFPTMQMNTPKWWDVSVTAILDKDGQPEKLLAVSRDVTELKQTEQLLRESHEHLEQQVAVRMRDLAERLTRFKALQSALYWAQFVVLFVVIVFPLTVYESYFREHKYGLSNQTFWEWMRDQLAARS